MKLSSSVLVVVSGSSSAVLLGEKACALPNSAESFSSLLDGVKAATVGLSLDCTVLGVIGSTPKGFMTDLASSGTDDDEATVALLGVLRVLVELVTVRFCECKYHRPSENHVQGKEARERFIRSNDSLAS